MRRFSGAVGLSGRSGRVSAKPETRAIRAAEMPWATSARRVAWARAVESSQLSEAPACEKGTASV